MKPYLEKSTAIKLIDWNNKLGLVESHNLLIKLFEMLVSYQDAKYLTAIMSRILLAKSENSNRKYQISQDLYVGYEKKLFNIWMPVINKWIHKTQNQEIRNLLMKFPQSLFPN